MKVMVDLIFNKVMMNANLIIDKKVLEVLDRIIKRKDLIPVMNLIVFEENHISIRKDTIVLQKNYNDALDLFISGIVAEDNN